MKDFFKKMLVYSGALLGFIFFFGLILIIGIFGLSGGITEEVKEACKDGCKAIDSTELEYKGGLIGEAIKNKNGG